ncbi:MAG TPA: SGNH/GDSL hydrolase family protein [Planctomycetia bacterium]|nr:SGNH/GDSL hydrolase family protein [Planctomycetia bacterium]
MPDAASTVKPKRRRGLLPRLALLLGSVLIALLCAEVGMRILGLPRDELAFLPKDGSVDWDCYCTNPRGYFKPRPGPNGSTIFCVDHDGAPPRLVDLKAAKAEGKRTILCIGDSFTWGLGVKIVDAYPYVLGELLAKASAKPVAVSNAGQVGRHVREIFEGQFLTALQNSLPDVVVYGWCMNDPVWDPARGVERSNPLAPVAKDAAMETGDIDDFINIRTANLKQLRAESAGQSLRRVSRLAELACRQAEAARIESRTLQFYRDLYDPVKNAGGLRLTWSSLAQMNEMQRSAGKRFVIAIFPLFVKLEGSYPLGELHESLNRKLTELKIDHLDLRPAFAGIKTEDLIVHPVDRHPNEVAHRLAAQAIADHLSRVRN